MQSCHGLISVLSIVLEWSCKEERIKEEGKMEVRSRGASDGRKISGKNKKQEKTAERDRWKGESTNIHRESKNKTLNSCP